MNTRLFSAALLIVGAVILGAPFAYADEQGVELSPAVFEDKVDPGRSYDFTLKVRNMSDTVKTYYLLARDIKSVDEGGRPEFAMEGEPTPFNLSTWVKLGVDSITVGPGETRSVPFTVSIPSDATPGAHFGGVFLESLPPKLRTTGTGVGLSVGSLINLQIKGDIIEEARLRGFSTGRLIYTALPVELEVRVENLGNALLRPTGVIEVVDMWGKQVLNKRVNENAAGIFPGTERPFKVMWEQSDFAFGRYQAVTSVVYGDQVRKTISASTSFWVLPMKPLAYFFGGILAFILILYFGVRGYIRHQLSRMGVKGGERTYDARYGRKMSRTTSIVITLFIFCVVFLLALLVLFA